MDKKQDHKRKADETPVAEKAKILKSLLNEDVNARDADGDTLLHQACISGRPDVAKLLIDNGADIHVENIYGYTPLKLACDHKSPEIVRLLIKSGADINVQDYLGRTPLQFAFGEKLYDIATLLIKKGAAINEKDSGGLAPLHWACLRNQSDIAALLIEKSAYINDPDDAGRTPLHWAAGRNYQNITQLLIDNDADINAQDNEGRTPLHLAIENNYNDIAKLLIENDADINARDATGKTALHWAIKNNHQNIATLIIEKDADINEKDSGGLAPLHWACLRNQPDIAALLIKQGADINDADNTGATPIHWAAGRNYQNITQLLIYNDADINAQDHRGLTPLHWAAGRNYQNITQLLIDNDADINAQDHPGLTPLYYAIENDCLDIATLLMERGADINAQDHKGFTPLDLALELDSQHIGKLLIERGANMNDIIALNSPWPDFDPITSLNIYMSDIESLDSFAPQNHLRVLAKVVLQSLREARSKLEKDELLTPGNVNILSRFKDAKMSEKLLPQETKEKFEFCTNPYHTKNSIKRMLSSIEDEITDTKRQKSIGNENKAPSLVIEDIENYITSFLVETTDKNAIAKNSPYNINFTASFFSRVENIAETLRAKGVITGGAKLEDVPGDGNCFFHAVSRLITGADHQTLRAIASRNIYDHQDQYREFVDGEETIEQYIIRNTQANTWADHLMIQSLADSLSNYRFEIIRSDGGRNIIEPRNIEEGSNLTTLMLYYTGNHYMAIVQSPETIRAPVIVAEDSEQPVPVVEIVSDYANDTEIDVHVAGDAGEINSATSYSEII